MLSYVQRTCGQPLANKAKIAVAQPRFARCQAEKGVVLIAEKLSTQGIEILEQEYEVRNQLGMTPEELCEAVKTADGLIIRSGTKVTREVFEASDGKLKVVGRAGVGIDNIDMNAATEFGCLVVNAPTANTVAAAEHGIALLCSVARNISAADASMKQGKWDRATFTGSGLTGKKLVIVGFGKVGTEVARRALGLGMVVYVIDPYVTEEKARSIGVKAVDMDEGLALGDFFSLHLPLTPLTKGLFGPKNFAKMKKGAVVINVARGPVIDEPALVDALNSGHIAKAALDVFENEPPAADDPLVNHPNVLCTPHLGASTVEAQEGVAQEVATAVGAALRGELAPTAVNAPMVPAEVMEQLAPFVQLAEGLGSTTIQLVDGGFDDIKISYHTARGDDLDTRLLRAMVIKGIIEATTDAKVNLVNADLLAKNRGYKIQEVFVPSEGDNLLDSMSVTLGCTTSVFPACVTDEGIYVEGSVRAGGAAITKVGQFDVDVVMDGDMVLVRQIDRPGIIASVATVLAAEQINVSYMTVGRTGKGQQAVMIIGVDSEPTEATMEGIGQVDGIKETTLLKHEVGGSPSS